jgi:hypothetical protein
VGRSARERVFIDDFAARGEVVECEMLYTEALFQDRAIVLLPAKLDSQDIDIGAGYCGGGYQLRRIQ